MIDSSRFLRVYANLPLAERNNVCVVIDGQPLTWNAAYNEIIRGSPVSQRILEQLVRLGLI